MSAIDRAFIKAYSDEPIAASEPPAATTRRSNSAEAKSANTSTATTKSTTTAAAPRKTAGRARRSAAAAAIRTDEPAANAVAASSSPQMDQRVSSPTPAASATVENKPKMVVGRKALQKLAESAVVPSPHMSFRTAGQVAGHSSIHGNSDIATRDEVADSVSRERSFQKPPFMEGNRAQGEASAAPSPKPSQFRLDPAVPPSTARKPSSSPAACVTVPTSLIAPPSASVETPELRPLSSYRAQQTPTSPVAFLEVDRLAWPSACKMLIERAGTELESAATMIAEQSLNESQTLAIASTDEGEGCTTIALCIAIKLAAQGARVCLVDGNVSRPQLAEMVGLEPERGLESVLAGEATLGEALIESLEDRVTLLPLCKPITAEMIERSKLRQTVTFGELRDQFDIVVVDAGCIGSPRARCSILDGGSIDAAILVGCASDERIAWQRAQRALEHRSIPCWGAIENRSK